MSIIYILIPIAILLTALGIYLFFWAVKTEQFDDLEKQGMSILFDDEKSDEPRSSVKSNESDKHTNEADKAQKLKE
ncbi:MAG: cbb3-type cytochrome oxidase assembly protein CcoS [Colwellia sp.]|nr:cbb3-type cytochrome oxidase assembly protein CcoS [Colwellia sp.]